MVLGRLHDVRAVLQETPRGPAKAASRASGLDAGRAGCDVRGRGVDDPQKINRERSGPI